MLKKLMLNVKEIVKYQMQIISKTVMSSQIVLSVLHWTVKLIDEFIKIMC